MTGELVWLVGELFYSKLNQTNKTFVLLYKVITPAVLLHHDLLKKTKNIVDLLLVRVTQLATCVLIQSLHPSLAGLLRRTLQQQTCLLCDKMRRF